MGGEGIAAVLFFYILDCDDVIQGWRTTMVARQKEAGITIAEERT